MPSRSELFKAIEAMRESKQAHEYALNQCLSAKQDYEDASERVGETEKSYLDAVENVKKIIAEFADEPLPLKWD